MANPDNSEMLEAQSPEKKEFIRKSIEFWNPGKTQFWQDVGVDLVIDRRQDYFLYDMASDADLVAFARRVLSLAGDPAKAKDIAAGRYPFRLDRPAPQQATTAPVPVPALPDANRPGRAATGGFPCGRRPGGSRCRARLPPTPTGTCLPAGRGPAR